MAVNVDTVYQQVLAIANKEQRGYITPQEFNLLAHRAQLQIFEEYFVDIKKAYLKPGNSSEASDELDVLLERLAVHRFTATAAPNAPDHQLASFFKVLNVSYNGIEIPEVDARRALKLNAHPLSAPTLDHPFYVRTGESKITIYPFIDAAVVVDVVEKPYRPSWGYVVVNEKPLYNTNTSTNFDLHESEEQNLVNRILELAGITMKKQDLVSIAGGLIQRDKIEENN